MSVPTAFSDRSVSRSPALAAFLLLSALLTGCVSGGASPPGVDVPEPGTSAARTTVSGTPTGARSYPAGGAQPPVTRPPAQPPLRGAVARPGVPAAETGGITVQPGAASAPPPIYPAPMGDAAVRAAPPASTGAVASAAPYPQEPAGAATPPPRASAPAYAIEAGHVPARSSNNAVNALLAHADTARRQGNMDAAIASAERALRIEPGDPAVYCELALLRLAQGQRGLAEQLARKGLAQQPDPELRGRLEDILARATAQGA